MTQCTYCKREFPDDLGGLYCPRCDDLINEAHDILKEIEYK